MIRVIVLLHVMLTTISVVHAEPLSLRVQVHEVKRGKWVYDLSDNVQTRHFSSDAEFGDALTKYSNSRSAILLSVTCDRYLPTSQLIKILEMTKKNPQEILIKTIQMHKLPEGSERKDEGK